MMGGYPGAPTGLNAGSTAYPPMLSGVCGPTDPYGASAAGAYPPPPVGSSLSMGGSSTFGGFNTNDLYTHAQVLSPPHLLELRFYPCLTTTTTTMMANSNMGSAGVKWRLRCKPTRR